PAVRPPQNPELLARLAALRDTDHRLAVARSSGAASAATLERDRARLEAQVRAGTLHVRGAAGRGERGPGAEQILAALGDGCLAELVIVDGVLYVLLCGGGRVRRFAVGPAATAVAEIEFARSRLRRLAYERRPDRAALAELGARLEASVLGPVAGRLGDGPVVVVPPSRLHEAPWGLLPSLRRRAFSIAPSAGAWLRAQAAERPGDASIVLVRGPEVANAEQEVRAIAGLYDEAPTPPAVLGGGSATTRAVLDAIDGCLLAHVAAHGTFRADSPLFSSLLLDDGPLTGYDLERLRRAPYRLVLSSCDSGQMAAVGADEVLGLATALLRLGTAGIVASVVPVNDETAVPVMVGLHAGLRRGLSLAEALCQARGDDVSFVAIGAG
ncbi:CHAT domain-containing protein, partial [Nonomuraea sp. NPDC005983]|uniref:CHAT domain-containing protein n=1 Tax=Nonomuraea sp. NPDC005983 TaxID=3155595 RepID=UPI0033BFA76F